MPRLALMYPTNRAGSIAEKAKRPRGRPRTGIGRVLSLRLYPEQEAALNAWIARQPDPKPSRADALRRLVEKGLEAEKA